MEGGWEAGGEENTVSDQMQVPLRPDKKNDPENVNDSLLICARPTV